MFSVIIPLYNKAPYIEKAMLSVLSQTYKEFELIVIDDGSTDNSFEIVQSLFSALTLPSGGWMAISQRNQGVSTTRNKGVSLAKYDYIAFLDADDRWAPTYLEEMKNLIECYPDAAIYSSAYYISKRNNLRLARIGVPPDFATGIINYFSVYANTGEMPVWTGATIIRKEIFDKMNGFKPWLKLGEDFDLWVRIALKYPVVFLNKPLAYYNQDVEQENRAIGDKLYQPEEHMLFSDYSQYRQNKDFLYLFETLALYGLLPYYIANKNINNVKAVLKTINWKAHPLKYRLYYRILPRLVVKFWFGIIKLASRLKRYIILIIDNGMFFSKKE